MAHSAVRRIMSMKNSSDTVCTNEICLNNRTSVVVSVVQILLVLIKIIYINVTHVW